MKYIICISIIFTLTIACTRRPSRLEQALALAGENRAELEKVLTHYSRTADDSLKLRAAVFLIENMRWHYCHESKNLDRFYATVDSVFSSEDVPPHISRQEFSERVKPVLDQASEAAFSGSLSVRFDLEHITSGLLISHVEERIFTCENGKQIWW
jgi:hypothetical protein